MLDFSFVCLDLETTGLEESAEIIEIGTVSYTHLDVYKRQGTPRARATS